MIRIFNINRCIIYYFYFFVCFFIVNNQVVDMTLPQYKISATLEGHTDDVKSVFACKDNSILSASRDGTVRRFAGENYELKGTYLGHTGYVNSVHYIEGL